MVMDRTLFPRRRPADDPPSITQVEHPDEYIIKPWRLQH